MPPVTYTGASDTQGHSPTCFSGWSCGDDRHNAGIEVSDLRLLVSAREGERVTTLENERFDIVKIVILSGWSLALLTCVTVIAAGVYMLVMKQPIDGPLKDWSMMCLAFLFTNFLPVVKDFVSK